MFSLLCISDSDKHFSTAIAEYEKRLGKSISIEEIKPSKENSPTLAINKETQHLISLLEKKYSQHTKILLIKEGDKLDTLEIANRLQGEKVVFIIGGPYGVDVTALRKAFPQLKEWSFWAITLPHGLAKLTLLEQLYRCSTLRSGKKYHY